MIRRKYGIIWLWIIWKYRRENTRNGKKIKVNLPKDYLDFVRKYNFARFRDIYFKDNLGNERSLEYIYSIDSEIGNSISGNGEYVNKALGYDYNRYLPILSTENINEKYRANISYDIENGFKLYIVKSREKNVEYIGETFTEFLSKLYVKKAKPIYPLEVGRILELEKKIKIKFPEKFVQIIEKYNGENINGKELYKTKSGKELGFGGFLNFNEGAEYDEFLKTFNDLVKHHKPSFPKKGVYPFSRTGGGV